MTSILVGSYLAVLSAVFALFFSYLLQQSKDKRKLMFLIVFVYSIFIRIPNMAPIFGNTQIPTNVAGWGPLPVTSAFLIVALAGLFNRQDFSKPFNIFLFLTGISTAMIVLPIPVTPPSEILYPTISVITILVSSYLVAKKRELPDFMFLLSVTCFALAGVGGSMISSETEFVTFAYTCAYIFLALVFVTSREKMGKGITSFFTLERKLKQTQQELESSRDQLLKAENNFKSLVNVIADPVAIVDHKGNFLEINDRIAEATGFSREELLGKNFMKTDIVTKKSKAILAKNLAKRMVGIKIKPYEIEAQTKSGDVINLEVNAKRIEYEGKTAEVVVFRDITERKKMEKQLEKHAEQLEEKVKERTKTLRENEEKLRSIFNSSPDAIAVSDLEGRVIECNNAILEFLKLSTKDEVIGKNSLLFVAEKDQEKIKETMKAVREGEPQINVEYDALNKDGYESPAEFSASVIKDQSGNPTGFVAVIKDITERKKKEDALYKSEAKNKAILNAIPDLMWQINKEGIFLEFLPTKEFPAVIQPEQMLGKNIHDVAPKWFAQKVMYYAKKAVETNEVQIFEYQLPFTSENGENHDYEARLVVGDDKEILTIVRDITERKRMENELRLYSERLEELVEERTAALQESQERLVKSEKLAAIGQAATMVGHDLRNPLQAIENGIYYINTELTKVPTSPKVTETLQAIHNSVDYADNIVKDLQSFAAKREPAFREIDINGLVEGTLSQVKTPENVKIALDLDELPKIQADKDMMKRIFVNLAVNGIQAMEKTGGMLKVKTRKINGCIQVSFKDTGTGMKKETMKRIFTPFFTTKAQGMGVGLAICKRFVEIHNGDITVESEEGRGSVFTVNLPTQISGGGKFD